MIKKTIKIVTSLIIAGMLALSLTLSAQAQPVPISTFPYPPSAPFPAGGSGETALDEADHFQDLKDTIENKWIPAFMLMAEQFSIVMMEQVFIIGTFFDAKQQMEVQRLFNQMTAEAHKDYHPDVQMCTFGTNIRSLAASEARARANARMIDMAMHRRESLSSDVSSAAGPDIDMRDRLQKYKKTNCDTSDSDGRLDQMCGDGGPSERINKDIDYTRFIEGNYTLDIDFSDTVNTPDEEDAISLMKNIFAFNTFSKVPEDHLEQEHAKDDSQDIRATNALRSVARNSFAHIIGMRGNGTEEVGPFMRNIILEMGVPDDEVDLFLGENPSYFAQMEILTRKMYQSPEFYANLYTKPANVERIGVSMQAIKLMHDRDRFEASLRREMLVSLILELKLRDVQDDVNNEILSETSTLFVNPAGP